MLFERHFSGSDEVTRPPLNWYRNDKEINNDLAGNALLG